MEQVVLVDESDNEVGIMEKMEAHRRGLLHRAFSVLIFNSRGELLLQKRADTKYHSAGLWTNTCCSHPQPGESFQDAIKRKLLQEMGISVQTEFVFKFLYNVKVDHDLIEHELDHVFVGIHDGEPTINTREAQDWKLADLPSLRNAIIQHPEQYTSWFKLIINHPQLSKVLVSPAC